MKINKRSFLLKEMGISEWISKESALVDVPPTPKSNNPFSQQSIGDLVQHVDSQSTTQMWWFFGATPNAEAQTLFQNIIRVLGIGPSSWTLMGTEKQINELEFPDKSIPLVAIAFGVEFAQKLSGEREGLALLRGAVHSIDNLDGESIPLIATFDLNHLLINPKDKKLLWEDLLLAKSILQTL